jgi:mono/diheme cytochrome c family protein
MTKTVARILSAAICLTFSASTISVCAQAIGDPTVGDAVAQQICAECHATKKGEEFSPNSKAPTFAELANTPGMTGTALMAALSTPHAGMPMFRLTRDQREGVIAYILSLRQ